MEHNYVIFLILFFLEPSHISGSILTEFDR